MYSEKRDILERMYSDLVVKGISKGFIQWLQKKINKCICNTNSMNAIRSKYTVTWIKIEIDFENNICIAV